MPVAKILGVWAAVLCSVFAGASEASRAVVPDDVPTIQQALDIPVDTVLVRPGSYAERVRLSGNAVLIGESAPYTSLPQLDGITLPANESSYRRVVRGFHIAGTINYNGAEGATFIEMCVLDSGFVYGPLPVDNHGIVIRDCTVRNGLLVASWGGATVIGNRVTGLLEVSTQGPLIVSENTSEGANAGLKCFESDGSDAAIEGNTVIGGSVGISVNCHGRLRVVGNKVKDCASTGLTVRSSSADAAFLSDNEALRCLGAGIEVSAEKVELYRNVIGRCEGDGIAVRSPLRVTVEQNTSYLNNGDGFDLSHSYWTVALRNIAYGNAGRGIMAYVATKDDGEVGCNDLFGNGISSGWPDDISVDPMFCDLANDDVSLRSDSPLLVGGCVGVGARGVSCDLTTEVLVVLLEAEASREGVCVRWQLGGSELARRVWVERSGAFSGPWQAIETERSLEGDVTLELDRSADVGRTYWYRLAWVADGRENWSVPTESRELGMGRLTTLELGPNPTDRGLLIKYSLRRSSVVHLTMHDLMGRRIAELASGPKAVGEHVVRWAGQFEGGTMAPGTYFLKLRSSEGEVSRTVIVRR